MPRGEEQIEHWWIAPAERLLLDLARPENMNFGFYAGTLQHANALHLIRDALLAAQRAERERWVMLLQKIDAKIGGMLLASGDGERTTVREWSGLAAALRQAGA